MPPLQPQVVGTDLSTRLVLDDASGDSDGPQQANLASNERPGDLELVEMGGHYGAEPAGATPHSMRLSQQDDDDEVVIRGAGSKRGRSSSSSNSAIDVDERDIPDGDSAVALSAPRPAREWPSVLRDGWRLYWTRSFRAVFLTSKLNILLLAVPLAIISRLAGWGDAPLLIFSLIGLCPLAERIAFTTDEMALYTNDTIGGLLSATMGNMTEAVVSIFALKNGLLRVVQLSLLGSIYSNLLLVQGMAFIVGGLKFNQQSYSQAAAKTNVSLLLLAVLSLMLPMVLIASNGTGGDLTAAATAAAAAASALNPSGAANATIMPSFETHEGITVSNALSLSRLASVLLLIVYALLILYQLKTHAHLFESQQDEGEGDEEPEPPILGPWGAAAWAAVVTLFIALLSEFIGQIARAARTPSRLAGTSCGLTERPMLIHCCFFVVVACALCILVSALEGAATSIGLPVLFIATILLPIVGNAAEHASAVVFAGRDKMDVALGISVGSSTQISLFVVPLMVVLGWAMGQPLSLDFQAFETVALMLTVLMTSVIFSSGKSDWLYGE